MKKLFLLPLLFLTLPVFAGRIDSQIYAQNVEVSLQLDKGNIFTEKVVDALIESPLVAEFVNDWVKPGTTFKGKGFVLVIPENSRGELGATLSFTLKTQDYLNITQSGNYLFVRSSSGPFKEFHQAILKSKSEYVLTQDRPGRISRSEGEVAILEGAYFSTGHAINCIPAFRQEEISLCTFEI